MAAPNRRVVELTSAESARLISKASILCLPLGAIEQHGPHLPLNTDVVVAEGLTRAIVARWGEEFDLWQLPVVPIGLVARARLGAGHAVAFDHRLCHAAARACRRRSCARCRRAISLIVNGHGGNRGILENLLHELAGDFGLNACAIHPFDLAKVDRSVAVPDVHGGRHETSVMLALAPDLVRRELIGGVRPRA